MSHFTFRLTFLLLVAGVGPLAGCAPTAMIPAPANKEALNAVLSHISLDAETTCEELRDSFDIEDLSTVDTPDEAGLDFEEYWVTTADGMTLRVWYLPAVLDRGTIVLSMGAVGQMPCYLFTTQLLVNNGWSVVMYDYRGFGGSGGVPDVAALADDLDAVLDWALAFTGRPQVTLMGISIGSVPSIAVAVERPTDVNAVLLDSPVIMSDQFRRLDFVLHGQVGDFISLLDPTLMSEDLIASLRQPILMLLAEGDRLIRPAAVEALFDLAAGPKTLVRFPGVEHARAPFRDTARYTFELETFLSQVWAQ